MRLIDRVTLVPGTEEKMKILDIEQRNKLKTIGRVLISNNL